MKKRVLIIFILAFTLLFTISLYPFLRWAENVFIILNSSLETSIEFTQEHIALFRDLSRFSVSDLTRRMFLYNAGVASLRAGDFSGAIRAFRESASIQTSPEISFRSYSNIGNAYVGWGSLLRGKQGKLFLLDAMDGFIQALSIRYDSETQSNYFRVLKSTLTFLNAVFSEKVPNQSLTTMILACEPKITLQVLSKEPFIPRAQDNSDYIQEWPCIRKNLEEVFSYIQDVNDTYKNSANQGGSGSESSHSSTSGESSSNKSSTDPGNRSWTNVGEVKFKYGNDLFDNSSGSWSRDAFFEKTIREIHDFQEKSGQYFLVMPAPRNSSQEQPSQKNW